MPGQKNKSKKKANYFLLVFACTSAILVFLGFIFWQRDKKQVELSPPRPSPSASANQVTKIKLPENFPKDFPVFQQAVLINAWVVNGKDSQGISVVWETDEPVSKVVRFYQQKLKALSWNFELVSEKKDSATLSFSKGKTVGFLGITTTDRKTVISVTFGLK